MMDLRLHRAFTTGFERLAAWSDLLDTINVYPVADADTGRNLVISLAPLHRIKASTETIARQLLVSATGNSGNIAVGFFAGFIEHDPAVDMHQAVKAGRERAWRAVADPKPGTMLTVFDELLQHIEATSTRLTAAAFPGLIEHLAAAVHSTAETIPAIKAAGVVDSGALGMFLFMEGFFSRIADRPYVFHPVTEIFGGKLQLPPDFVPGDVSKGYCVDTVIRLYRNGDLTFGELPELGDCLVVQQDNERVKIHIHTEQREAVRKQVEQTGKVERWSEQGLNYASRTGFAAAPNQAIHIVTDAAGSIGREEAAALGMTLLDSYIIVDDRSLPETMFPPGELYALMRSGVRVTTAQASVFERHQCFQSIVSLYDQTLYLCVGSVYTGNYAVVTAWKESHDLENRLKVIDTGSASGRLGIAARATARYAQKTDKAEQVIQFAEAAVRTSEEYIFLDRLQYLAAGGRLSKTKGFLGDMLQMKPVITPSAEGALKVGTLRNKSEQVEFALRKLERKLGQTAEAMIMLEYSDNREWVEEAVLVPIRKRYASAEITLCPLSLTSGAHMGPGTWAVAFLPACIDPLRNFRAGPDTGKTSH
jgi:DegV family protein with EDD domain